MVCLYKNPLFLSLFLASPNLNNSSYVNLPLNILSRTVWFPNCLVKISQRKSRFNSRFLVVNTRVVYSGQDRQLKEYKQHNKSMISMVMVVKISGCTKATRIKIPEPTARKRQIGPAH